MALRPGLGTDTPGASLGKLPGASLVKSAVMGAAVGTGLEEPVQAGSLQEMGVPPALGESWQPVSAQGCFTQQGSVAVAMASLALSGTKPRQREGLWRPSLDEK